MGWPMYYGGCQDGGCHAFVCDGYDDYDCFHFNLGWGGGSDGWYIIDEAPYTSPADAMFNFVPAEVYNLTAEAPSNFTAVPVSDTELKTRLHWTNPTTTLDGTVLNALEEVVVLRNNKIIGSFTNVAPGSDVEMVDEDVPFYDTYHYAVYVVANGRVGRHANAMDVLVGPFCTWKVIMTSESFQGWNGGYLSVFNGSGHEIARCTMTSSASTMTQPDLPLGTLCFAWTPPTEVVSSMSLIVKDSEGNTVYSFTGSSEELESGVLFTINNSCGGSLSCEVPENLLAVEEEGNIRLLWDAVPEVGYGYNLYRDGLLFRLVPSATTFLDEDVTLGGHCYRVSVLCEGGESGQFSNESCASIAPCYPPHNLDFEYTSNFKVKLLWEEPVPSEGLSGYYLYRKHGEEGEYQRIKSINAPALNCVDNSLAEEGDYYYRLCAYYHDLDCLSAPANRANETNVFEVHVYYSPTGVAEEQSFVKIVPNPTSGTVTVSGQDIRSAEVLNVLGQTVKPRCEGTDSLLLDLTDLPSGVYFIRIWNVNGTSRIQKVVKRN